MIHLENHLNYNMICGRFVKKYNSAPSIQAISGYLKKHFPHLYIFSVTSKFWDPSATKAAQKKTAKSGTWAARRTWCPWVGVVEEQSTRCVGDENDVSNIPTGDENDVSNIPPRPNPVQKCRCFLLPFHMKAELH